MKILKNNTFQFEVLSKTEDVIGQIAKAARTCYKSEDKSTPENDIKLVRNLLTRGHEAMIEFADMTIKFTGVSRGFCNELVRHRIASYAQESTRYVDESEFEVVVPPHKDEKEFIGEMLLETPDNTHSGGIAFKDWLRINEKMYCMLRSKGWKPEDARQILPTAIKADIVIKANLREWRQIFRMRCDFHAHWEIRAVMLELLAWCQIHIPIVFEDFHFFVLEDNVRYARPVISETRLKDEIKHYAKAINKTPKELLEILFTN